jgi:hypothetical protein
MSHLVQANVVRRMQTATMLNMLIIGDEEIREYRVEKPLKRLAVQACSQSFPLGCVPRIDAFA